MNNCRDQRTASSYAQAAMVIAMHKQAQAGQVAVCLSLSGFSDGASRSGRSRYHYVQIRRTDERIAEDLATHLLPRTVFLRDAETLGLLQVAPCLQTLCTASAAALTGKQQPWLQPCCVLLLLEALRNSACFTCPGGSRKTWCREYLLHWLRHCVPRTPACRPDQPVRYVLPAVWGQGLQGSAGPAAGAERVGAGS